MSVPEKIVKVLLDAAAGKYDYVNPNMLTEVYETLQTYHHNISQEECDIIEEYISDMWGA